MLEKHLPRIKRVLNTADVDIQGTTFGYVVIKGNWIPSQSVDKIIISGLGLDLREKVLHERVLIINQNIPIRSHEEEDQEIVVNMGPITIKHVLPKGGSHMIRASERKYSVNGDFGFFHGFEVNKVGILYVAKALKLDFVEGNSFRMPKNSYKGE